MKDSPSAATIDEYINNCEPDIQGSLHSIRSIILSECPNAEEKISYQIPTFKYLYSLVGFGTSKKGISFYTMNPKLVEKLSSNWENISYNGSTLYFKSDEEIPEQVIREIVRFRMEENEERARDKK